MDPKSSTTDDPLQWVRAAFARHEGPLIRFAVQFTGDADRARDVVQDTFIRLCRALRGEGGAKAPPPERVAVWLFQVCRNRALDVMKKERRMNYPGDDQLAALQGRGGPSPAALAEARAELRLAARVLQRLPERQQEVVRLKLQAGLSYAEISEVTGHTVSYVGVLLHQALQAVRQRLRAAEGSKTGAR
jgi:RNA polymerase sigma factor (sigma-70 family)